MPVSDDREADTLEPGQSRSLGQLSLHLGSLPRGQANLASLPPAAGSQVSRSRCLIICFTQADGNVAE